MLKNSFFEYGLGSKVLNYTVFALLMCLWLCKILNELFVHNKWNELYYFCIFVIFIMAIIRFFWTIFNKTPFIKVYTKWRSVLFKLNSIVLYIMIFVFSIIEILLFLTTAYYQYQLDISYKTDYQFFNITIIPFSVTRLVGDILTTYTSIDILKLKVLLTKVSSVLWRYILPFLSITYFVQLYFYNKVQKENLPEII